MVLSKTIFCTLLFVVFYSSLDLVAADPVETNEVKTNGTGEIWCFQCNSAKQKECYDLKTSDTQSTLYKKCPQFDEVNVTEKRNYFCRKTTQTVMTEEIEEKRIIRSCGWVPQEKPCYKITNPAHKEVVCACKSNACNSAPAHISISVYMLLLCTAAAIFKVLR